MIVGLRQDLSCLLLGIVRGAPLIVNLDDHVAEDAGYARQAIFRTGIHHLQGQLFVVGFLAQVLRTVEHFDPVGAADRFGAIVTKLQTVTYRGDENGRAVVHLEACVGGLESYFRHSDYAAKLLIRPIA